MSDLNSQELTQTKNFAAMIKEWGERGGNEPTDIPEEQPQERKEIKLKQFPNEVACLPNEWIRSGLFSASSKIVYEPDPLTKLPERVFYARKRMPSFSENVELHYTGYHLNLFDLRVYLAAIRESKTEYLQRKVSITPYQFMEAARIPRCGKNKAFIYKSLTRLSDGTLHSETYETNKNGKRKRVRAYHDHLIYKFREEGTWDITLSEDLAIMFEKQTSWVDWLIWNSLKGEIPRALMLHVCAHEAHPSNPQRIRLEIVKELLRLESPMKRVREFMKTSGIQLIEKGVVKTWNCENDIWSFTRDPKRFPKAWTTITKAVNYVDNESVNYSDRKA